MAASEGEGAATLSGACLCGEVAFEAAADRFDVVACHCSQCRAWSGHHWASINVPLDGFRLIQGEASLKWRRSSDYARRGFCRECGSALFWHADGLEGHKHRIAVAAGALAGDPRVRLSGHIFTASKGAYYVLADGLPQTDTF